MSTLIYGGGAVGLGLAGFLLPAGEQVDILARKETMRCLRQDGLQRSGIFGEYHAGPREFGCFSVSDDLPGTPYDFILICTKSFDSVAAAQDLARNPSLLHDRSRIILVQNGWGNAEIFAAHFPAERICNARVITGFCRPQKNHVEITVHVQPVHIGSLFGNDPAGMEHLCQLLSRGGMPCAAVPDIARDLWAKMLFNCALNPLGAIFNVPYGSLAEQEPTRKIMNEVIHEVFSIMKAVGYSTHWPDAAEYLEAFYGKIVPLAAEHASSTLQDIRAGKKTEIDALNGAVLRLGRENGIAVPCNEMLYNMIRFMERSGAGGSTSGIE
ncbi:MAG: ketopantoate reductase family protein [Candidatus Electrothrix sp. YB6]